MSFHADRATDHEVRPRVRTLADLVAAVPSLLGFHPRNSLVLVSIRTEGDPYVACASRVDLPPPRRCAELARHLGEIAVTQRCDEVLLAVVGGGVGRDAGPPRRDVVDAVALACASVGVLVQATVWVAELVAGAPWRCYGECGCAGVLPDPACSPVAAASVAAGRVIYADRSELERLVEPADPVAGRRRSALLDAHCDRASRSGEPVGATGPEALALVRRWVERASAAERPRLDDDDVVSLCLALGDPTVRDACLGFACAEQASAAERLWTALVTEAPDPEAAEPAVLLAHCALLRGNGALAGIALERAQRAWPGHRLSAMFQTALGAGLGPDELSDWFAEGIGQARALLSGAR